MSQLQLKILQDDRGMVIQFIVDGENLALRSKRLFEFDDDLSLPGLDYDLEDTVLGYEVRKKGARNAILFVCCCRVSMCSCIRVDVTVTESNITFSNFWGCGSSTIEPITFDRDQYEAAVAEISEMIEKWNPRKQ